MSDSMITSVELDDVEITFWCEAADPSVGIFHSSVEVDTITIPGLNDDDPRIDITHTIDDVYKESLCNEYVEYQQSMHEAQADDRYQAMKEDRGY